MTDLSQFANAALDAIQNGNKDAGTNNAAVNAYTQSAFGNVLDATAPGFRWAGNAEQAAQKAATSLQIQKLVDAQDPNKYQKVRKADGGFEFLDPSGNPINVSQYAQVTGQTRANALKDSENPLDKQFVNDYGNLDALTKDINNGNKAGISTFLENNKNIGANATPQDLMQQLVDKYPHIFGQGTYDQSAANLNKPLFSAYQPPNSAGSANGAAAGGINGSSYGY